MIYRMFTHTNTHTHTHMNTEFSHLPVCAEGSFLHQLPLQSFHQTANPKRQTETASSWTQNKHYFPCWVVNSIQNKTKAEMYINSKLLNGKVIRQMLAKPPLSTQTLRLLAFQHYRWFPAVNIRHSFPIDIQLSTQTSSQLTVEPSRRRSNYQHSLIPFLLTVQFMFKLARPSLHSS